MTVVVQKENTHNWALICSSCGNVDLVAMARASLPYVHQCTRCGAVGVTRLVQSLHRLLKRTHEMRSDFRHHHAYVISQCHRSYKEYARLRR